MLNDERMKRRQATRDAILDVERETRELEEEVDTGTHDLEELKRRATMPSAPTIIHIPSKPSSAPPSSRRRHGTWTGIAAVIVALGSSGVIAQACQKTPAGAK